MLNHQTFQTLKFVAHYVHTCYTFTCSYLYCCINYYFYHLASSTTHTPPKLKQLQLFRSDIGDDWFDLGVELLDSNDEKDLGIIESDYPRNSNRCCTKMFQLWLDRYPSASWEDLIHALETIELNTVANKVSEFCGKILVCCSYPL